MKQLLYNVAAIGWYVVGLPILALEDTRVGEKLRNKWNKVMDKLSDKTCDPCERE